LGDVLSDDHHLWLDRKCINDESDCYVIAEIGHNHQGDLNKCIQLFDAARLAGCDAVKLQKRDNKTLYTEEAYNKPYMNRNSFGKTYGEHREALEFGIREYTHLQAYAESIGLTFFATAFDLPSLQFLVNIKVPAIKIASGDLTNIELLRAVAQYGRPVLVSTGGGSMEQVRAAHEILWGTPHAIMQCTSGYPAKYDELHLRVISTYRDEFPEQVIGWSAHDTGIAMALVAYTLGARIIEKHFTLNRAWKGTDQAMSLEPQGMKKMVRDLRRVRGAMGSGDKCQLDSEVAPLLKQRKNAEGRIDGCTSA